MNSNLSILIAPNPTSDFVDISVNGAENSGSITISDVSGRVIYNSQVISGNSLRVATSEWSAGVYVVTFLTNDGKQHVSKLVKN
jgi:hypothetical protein